MSKLMIFDECAIGVDFGLSVRARNATQAEIDEAAQSKRAQVAEKVYAKVLNGGTLREAVVGWEHIRDEMYSVDLTLAGELVDELVDILKDAVLEQAAKDKEEENE